MAEQVYECHNSQCTLGSRKEPGRFTGGMTREGIELLYGTITDDQMAEENLGIGEGYCPNCGTKGTPVTVDGEPLLHESLVGTDEYQDLHEAVNAKVLAGDLPAEEAQATLKELVAADTSTSEQP